MLGASRCTIIRSDSTLSLSKSISSNNSLNASPEVYSYPLNRYLICLTIGPAFISASIYICLGRIVVIYGEGISRLRPRTYTIVFILCDLISLILQAAGGAITSIADADQRDLAQAGINIMIAGLASQVASLAMFMILCLDFAWKVRKNQHELIAESRMVDLRNSFKWKAFMGGEFPIFAFSFP